MTDKDRETDGVRAHVCAWVGVRERKRLKFNSTPRIKKAFWEWFRVVPQNGCVAKVGYKKMERERVYRIYLFLLSLVCLIAKCSMLSS